MPEEQFLKETAPEVKRGVGSERLEIKEEEVKELKDKVEKLEAQIEEKKKPVAEDKERMVKREIKDYLQELQEMPASAAPIATRDEADEVSKFPPSQQIGALISLAVEKGIKKAISVANDIDNPAILDEFHDILIDRYYQELVDKKIIKSP